MDKSSSVVAAFNAGKLPTQKQVSQGIDRLLASPFLTNDPSTSVGELSAQGKQLQDDLRSLLNAYKKLGDDKNGDNVIQESLWHLSEADISNTSTSGMDVDTDQASKDAHALAKSLRTLVSIVWENLSEEGRSVFHDFASFMRLALADAAEHVGDSAKTAAEALREVDKDVQEGQRNELGIKRKAEDEPEDADARAKFERAMDSTKEVGSKAIGAGQVAIATGEDLANRTSTSLQGAFYKICDRAQSDEAYHDAISTIFDVFQKWIHRSLDAAGDVNQATSLDAFINDPTPDKHLITAIRGFREFTERLAGGKSLDDFFACLRVCSVDIQQDEDVRQWFDEFIAHCRKSLDERGYARSDEAQQKSEKLRNEWKALLDKDSDKGRKWKEDVGKLKQQASEFQKLIDHDADLRQIRRTRAKLGEDIENSLLVAASTGTQSLMERAPWFWQDVFNVYLPKLVAAIKDIPIPRTEYKDNEVEFVLEDLDISTFSMLPGHAYIRNITDIDIKAPSVGQTDTSVGTLTRVYLQGLQLQLKEVSFYYYDKTASMGPAEFSGLMEFTIPPAGVDVDIVVRSIPNSPEGLRERERRESFLDIQRVDVKVSEDITLNVKQSNHQILVSVFRPIMLSRFRESLQTVLAQQIRGALEGADAFAWDVGRRAEVFEDTGLPRGASLVAGVWSELGHLQRMSDGGLFTGWKATGTGVIKSDKNATFAMGAEPQVLSGEKRGPKGNFADSVQDRMDTDVDLDAKVAQAKGVAEQVKETVKEEVQKVKSWKDTVNAKVEEERGQPGWQSAAFDWS
ncbi:hypothetical protein L226DRAFT_461468 [Lentinus tigrinus ALCF2SS1-7]|uniref:Uncharacterized protein n=1 Tax=Lentinus tigrinus ALCF2SS1-6 TaxID=1328759 RepID=A0A5C2SBE7_9APHY|nr:hypothetical protein L227DRAFT_501622 [Lentinus tigrinus ALCF2SS1-6]RPD75712.1 hypothetical protein L226DRAFT_461468 [Lentinus tigrinus ALCF2SS1-7]